MKLFNVLAATVAAAPLSCDVSTLFAATCGVEGFNLGVPTGSGVSPDCAELATNGAFTVTVVATGGDAPSATQTCPSATLTDTLDVDVLSGTDDFDSNCWSAEVNGDDDLVMSADVYITDSDYNRPFNLVQVSCTIPTALTVDSLTYTVIETSVTGPVETGSVDALAVKAWFDGFEDTTDDKVFGVGSHVFFYVEPPADMHAALTVTAGSCMAGSQTIEESWLYGLTDTDCEVTSESPSHVIGACMHIFASQDASTTISCSASLALA